MRFRSPLHIFLAVSSTLIYGCRESKQEIDPGIEWISMLSRAARCYEPLFEKLKILRSGPIPKTVLEWKAKHFHAPEDTVLFLYAPHTFMTPDKVGWLVKLKDNNIHFFAYRIKDGSERLETIEVKDPVVQVQSRTGIKSIKILDRPHEVVMAIDSLIFDDCTRNCHDYQVIVEGRYGDRHNWNIDNYSSFYLSSTVDASYSEFWHRTQLALHRAFD